MTRILAVSGSLRRQSYNTALLHAARELAPQGVDVDVVTLHGIPLYDGDVEQQDGIPDAVKQFQQKIRDSDGLLLGTPEYNSSMPGVFKNALDWASRPPADGMALFQNRAVALVSASPSGFGGVLAQTAWLPVLRLMGTRLYAGPRIAVPRAMSVFDAQGRLTDEPTREHLASFVAGFAAFAAKG